MIDSLLNLLVYLLPPIPDPHDLYLHLADLLEEALVVVAEIVVEIVVEIVEEIVVEIVEEIVVEIVEEIVVGALIIRIMAVDDGLVEDQIPITMRVAMPGPSCH